MMPSLFLAHGSPMLAIEETPYTDFLRKLGKTYRPKAIVIFTAHWESRVLTVSSTDDVYETIYDFGGFPPELYAVTYKARGSVKLANDVRERFAQNGIETLADTRRGLDHGSWTLLHRMYPEADIPVVQISVHPFLPPAEQFRIGQALSGLGEHDILVIGSGVTVHNFAEIHWGQSAVEPWAEEFDQWLIDRIAENDCDALFRYKELAPHARRAVPREEHFVPLFIALGAGQGGGKPIYRSYDMGTLSYLCMSFA
ncbi:MAG TPA: class III extradiol ring-cleavage dioxygenase [Paenibacillus sp.]|uniref:DODA-type extradiol aromatic ring-opening family dioxygenase n=1 Tax=Paenibacillus sp. TaxID=58172 RepID=UPI002D1DF534|nr:class III extradiol ring-cleavage dioxygenase [Paenibacillus sp.]HUC92623.1 class III extradiol ring-cleavage dioxygenase [Paenibacillus sp.]